MDGVEAGNKVLKFLSFSYTISPFTQKHLRVWLIAETVFNIPKGSPVHSAKNIWRFLFGFKGTENDITFALIQAAEQGPVWTVTA